MGFVAASMVRGGIAEAISLDGSEAWTFADRDFVWIGLVEPSEPELRLLARRFGLHDLAVADALSIHQLPKIETYGDQLFIVVRTARLQGDTIAYGQTYIFVGRHFIITVRYGSSRTHADLRAQLQSSIQGMRHGVDFVLHGILDFVVDGYMPIFAAIEEEVLRFEARVLDEPLTRSDIRRIFAWRGELARFARLTEPMLEMSSRLQHMDLPCIQPDMRPYFRDIDDHIRRLAAMVDGLRDVLRSAFEISMLLEQQQQSIVTRKLAAWAAILAIPTAVAGLYGMNFDNMPELHLRYGYFAVLGAIGLSCGLLYARFRRIGWL